MGRIKLQIEPVQFEKQPVEVQDLRKIWSEMTLNYCMMVERYPNLKEEVGGSIPGCEISSLLHKFLTLAYQPSISNKQTKKLKKKY